MQRRGNRIELRDTAVLWYTQNAFGPDKEYEWDLVPCACFLFCVRALLPEVHKTPNSIAILRTEHVGWLSFAVVSSLSPLLFRVSLLFRLCPMRFEQMCARSMRGHAATFIPVCAFFSQLQFELERVVGQRHLVINMAEIYIPRYMKQQGLRYRE